MKITIKLLDAEQARLTARKDQLIADLNGTIGALQEVERLKTFSRAKPQKAAPAPSVKSP